jgi:hypothetical protein
MGGRKSDDKLGRFGMQIPYIRLYPSSIPPYDPQHGPSYTRNGGHPCLSCCYEQ